MLIRGFAPIADVVSGDESWMLIQEVDSVVRLEVGWRTTWVNRSPGVSPRRKFSSFAVARPYFCNRFALLPQDLTQKEEIGEQCSEVDGSVQIIDQLGTDRGLSENISIAARESRESRSRTAMNAKYL